MAKNPKLEALKKQAAELRQRLASAPQESAEAAKLTREVKKLDQLIELYQEQIAGAEKIADLEKVLDEQARADDTRFKIIVGGSVLADAELKPETRRGVLDVVRRAVKAQRDREFIEVMFTRKGWL